MASLLKRAQEARARHKQEDQRQSDEDEYDRKYNKQNELAERKASLEQKQEERELRKQEREVEHPVRTRAIRRAEKLTEKFLSQGEQVAQKAPKVAGKGLQKVVRMQKSIRVRSGFQEGQPSGRNRLPVFAPSTGMGAGIAEETSRPPQPMLQQQQPQQFFSSKPMELFSSGKQYDLGLGSNLVSGNGNKKKKEVRYY